MNIAKPLLEWYDIHKRALPWRGADDPYRIWLSEIMLQQTRAETVKSYYARFLEAFPDARALAEADEEQVLKLWEGLGYYARARNLHAAAKRIADTGFPDTSEGLRALPGVGPYAANAIASIAFGESAPALDGNQARVLARLTAHDQPLKTPFDLESTARRLMADTSRPGDYNQALMDLSAMICAPKKPNCAACPLSGLCAAHAEREEEHYPVRLPKAAKKEEDVLVILVTDGHGHIAIRRRPSKGMLGGLYEFCLTEPADAAAYLIDQGFTYPAFLRALPPSKHVFTHRIWRMNGQLFRAERFPEGYTAADSLSPYAFPTALRVYTGIAAELLKEQQTEDETI